MNNSYRRHIFPLVKLLQNYPSVSTNFTVSESLEDTNISVLPMSWNYYHITKSVNLALEYLDSIRNSNTPIYSIVNGDAGCKVPKSFNGYVLRASGERSKLPKNHLAIPIFVEDPLRKIFRTSEIINRSYSEKPVVGFCGQANRFGKHTLIDLLRVCAKNALYHSGMNHLEPQKIMSTTYFRHKILEGLAKNPAIETNFLIREHHRAGVTVNKEAHISTMEFYENMKHSDYVVCMRGAGNFSNRFYETLAMGRIPVFVNTDCLLPFEDDINWKEHVVWVEYEHRHKISEKVLDFHSQLDESKLNALFERNRKLWENRLTLPSYFKTLLHENQ